MKKILQIIAFLISTQCCGQDIIKKEIFLNDVYQNYVDVNFTQYYLANQAYRYCYSYQDTFNIKSEFGRILPKKILQQLITNAWNDTLTENWDCSSLSKAICISEDSASEILKGPCPIIYAKWSKRKKEKVIKRQELAFRKQWNRIAPEKRVVFYFTKPIFDSSFQYALIRVSESETCSYLFKNENGIWLQIAKGIPSKS
jgi:hypothetical protein